MLRLTVLILILANVAYFAWAQGLLQPWGLGSFQRPEPQRLQQQIRPEALRLIRADEAVVPGAEASPGGPPAASADTLASRPAALKSASQPPAAAGP